MCGIAGIYNYLSSKEPSSEINVKKMLALISHRGPDESGLFLDENIGIGSVRLSIIDLHLAITHVFEPRARLVVI